MTLSHHFFIDDEPMQPAATVLLDGQDFPLQLRRHLTASARTETGPVQEVVEGMLASHSLNLWEKMRVLDSELSEFQQDELVKVFAEEQAKFSRLFAQHPDDIFSLTAMSVVISFTLGRLYGLDFGDDLEEAHARRIVRRIRHRVGGVADQLMKLPENCWGMPHFAWFWRHLMPSDHRAWDIAPPHGRILESI